MPPKSCARTYREMKTEAENMLLYINLYSIKWIKNHHFSEKNPKNYLQWFSFMKCNHLVLTKLFFLLASTAHTQKCTVSV